jgi:sulfur-carrier protein
MKILIPAALHSYTRGARIEAEGHTLAALFDDLDRRYPGLRFRVVDELGRLRPNMRIFVNGLGVRDMDFALQHDDDVAVVLALSGG